MAKFHINNKGVPAPCKAIEGNCPLGGEGEHFDSLQQAQEYINNKFNGEYGTLPSVDSNEMNVSDKWRNNILSHEDYQDFIAKHARELMSEKPFGDNVDIRKESLRQWKNIHNENSLSELRELNEEETANIVRNNIESSTLHGWFREYNSDCKPKIVQALITNPELRNASMNIAYNNYKVFNSSNISYEDFLNKEVELYRGGNFDFIPNDEFISYSLKKDVAEKFARESGTNNVHSIKVKIRDTLGSLQTTGEAEVMVMREHTEI